MSYALSGGEVHLRDARTETEFFAGRCSATAVYVGLPAEADSCGGCGFPAFEIRLTEDEKERWRQHLASE